MFVRIVNTTNTRTDEQMRDFYVNIDKILSVMITSELTLKILMCDDRETELLFRTKEECDQVLYNLTNDI